MIEIRSILDSEPALRGVDAAIFDLDDTLYPEKAYVRSGFAALAARFPQIPGMDALLWDAFESGRPAIDTVLEEYALTGRKTEALAVYRAHRPDIELYPGVYEMLRRLKTTKKLGLITDGRPEGQRAKIRALGLEELMDEIIVTDELGGIEFRKPNAAAFELMHRRLDVPFARMAYVADNPRKDFTAPGELGMLCLWFRNPDGLYYEDDK